MYLLRFVIPKTAWPGCIMMNGYKNKTVRVKIETDEKIVTNKRIITKNYVLQHNNDHVPSVLKIFF